MNSHSPNYNVGEGRSVSGRPDPGAAPPRKWCRNGRYFMVKGDPTKRWVVYEVECADGCVYVGITQNLTKRLEDHLQGRGAQFTRRHGYVGGRAIAVYGRLWRAELAEKERVLLLNEQGVVARGAGWTREVEPSLLPVSTALGSRYRQYNTFREKSQG